MQLSHSEITINSCRPKSSLRITFYFQLSLSWESALGEQQIVKLFVFVANLKTQTEGVWRTQTQQHLTPLYGHKQPRPLPPAHSGWSVRVLAADMLQLAGGHLWRSMSESNSISTYFFFPSLLKAFHSFRSFLAQQAPENNRSCRAHSRDRVRL